MDVWPFTRKYNQDRALSVPECKAPPGILEISTQLFTKNRCKCVLELACCKCGKYMNTRVDKEHAIAIWQYDKFQFYSC